MNTNQACNQITGLRGRLAAEAREREGVEPLMAAAFTQAVELLDQAFSILLAAGQAAPPTLRDIPITQRPYSRTGYAHGKRTVPRTAAALRIRENRAGEFEVYGTKGRAVVETFSDRPRAAAYIAEQLRVEAQMRAELLSGDT